MVAVNRPSDVVLRPDSARTVIRPFAPEDPEKFVVEGHPRAERITRRILALAPEELAREMETVTRSLDARHRDVEARLLARYDDLGELNLGDVELTHDQKVLVGAYFSEEFSFESAALFNPSVVALPDQTGVDEGDVRFVLSLRGIGEGHVSSLTFRTGVWRADGSLEVDPPSALAVGPRVERETMPGGQLRVQLHCGGSREISETVIFPFLPSQGRGIEDVRLTPFTDGDGRTEIRGTYTAFSGMDVRQGLLQTTDFKTFEMRGVEGDLYSGKGMALFPRMVGGRYAMLARQDNESVWLVFSDDLYKWSGGQKLLSPKFPWEFIQMGNCGSPIEIDEGWLVLTHGVGTVRNYCVGAALLDKDDPSKVLGRLPEPLLAPQDKERDGYVPNVVYSCGGLLRGRTLLLPYGVADDSTAFASFEVDEIVQAMV